LNRQQICISDIQWLVLEADRPERAIPSLGKGARHARRGTFGVTRHFHSGKLTITSVEPGMETDET
jgi:hypothetical protein